MFSVHLIVRIYLTRHSLVVCGMRFFACALVSQRRTFRFSDY
jgi:hypothetical protein